MHRNRPVSQHQFSMVPRADIPRSSFRMQKTVKTTFDSARLVPVFCEEVLPGDKFKLNMTGFARLATPLFPIMDNLHFECFWFFCPMRLVWNNWVKFMGERDDIGDSIAFQIPQMVCPADGYAELSLQDYFGLPTTGQILVTNTFTHSSLPLRMYNLIYNEWFRDENLLNSVPLDLDDGPDSPADYILLDRGKRHDYFTSCLPFLQKGFAQPIIFGTTNVQTFAGTDLINGTQAAVRFNQSDGTNPANSFAPTFFGADGQLGTSGLATGAAGNGLYPTNLFVDLSAATNATINNLRTSFQIQKLLERDNRGGTRYTEIIRSHFGVVSPDARLQRPEYLGGSSIPIAVNPVAQTSATAADGTDTPQGTLSAIGTGLLRAGFTQAFTEHGYVIGIVSVRGDLTYQQGLRRHWSRLTRYDFYFPAFAMLGEQAVLNKEIYCIGSSVQDDAVFGYQERWAEYRYTPSEIMGLFKSSAVQTIDPWHLSEFFASLPVLNGAFIADPSRSTVERTIAVGAAAGGQQFIADFFYDLVAVRPMPMYSVPGMVDHF